MLGHPTTSTIIHKYSFLKCCSTVRNCVPPSDLAVCDCASLESSGAQPDTHGCHRRSGPQRYAPPRTLSQSCAASRGNPTAPELRTRHRRVHVTGLGLCAEWNGRQIGTCYRLTDIDGLAQELIDAFGGGDCARTWACASLATCYFSSNPRHWCVHEDKVWSL